MTGSKCDSATKENMNIVFGEDPHGLTLSAMQMQFGMMRTQIAMLSLTIADMQLHIRQIEESAGVSIGNDIGVDDLSEDGYSTDEPSSRAPRMLRNAPRTLARKCYTRCNKYESDAGYDTDEVSPKAPPPNSIEYAKYDTDEGYDTDETSPKAPPASSFPPPKPAEYVADEAPVKTIFSPFVYDVDDGYDTDEAFSRALCDASKEAREALESIADANYESDDGYDTDEKTPKEGAFVMVPPLTKIYGNDSELSEVVKIAHF